jgi:hypothetical protein
MPSGVQQRRIRGFEWAESCRSLGLEGKAATSEKRTFTTFEDLDLDWRISSL